MANLRNYIFLNFNQVFFPLFFTLFFISSVILFVKIAGLTSIVQITFYELFKLYYYSMPGVIFFTIPVSFFAGAVIALNKMSYDYEMPVLFSLGMSPRTLLRLFFKLSVLVSVLLLIISLGMVPLSKQLYKGFLEEKQNSANINIRTTEFGQKFGDWMIYINENDEENKKFKDVVMFSPTSFQKESFIMAKDAEIIGDELGIRLELSQGKAFLEQNNTLEQINYQTMQIRDMSQGAESDFAGIITHWKEAFEGDNKRAKELCASVLTSLFPFLSVFLILTFGIHNPRYQKNRSYFFIIIACSIFYGITYSASISMPFLGMIIVPVVWFGISYSLYRKFVAKYY